jgi:hypothetical protein
VTAVMSFSPRQVRAARAIGTSATISARAVSVAPSAPAAIARDTSSRSSMVMCVVAALMGIAIGVWLSMRWDR